MSSERGARRPAAQPALRRLCICRAGSRVFSGHAWGVLGEDVIYHWGVGRCPLAGWLGFRGCMAGQCRGL